MRAMRGVAGPMVHLQVVAVMGSPEGGGAPWMPCCLAVVRLAVVVGTIGSPFSSVVAAAPPATAGVMVELLAVLV